MLVKTVLQDRRNGLLKRPELNDPAYLRTYFRTLRLKSFKICEVDKEMAEFKNLEELNLSGNDLSAIEMRNLPPKLKYLHAYDAGLTRLVGMNEALRSSLLSLGVGYNDLRDDLVQAIPNMFP